MKRFQIVMSTRRPLIVINALTTVSVVGDNSNLAWSITLYCVPTSLTPRGKPC